MKPVNWYKLHRLKDRLDAGAFAVEGERAIRQILQSGAEILEIVTCLDEPAYQKFPIRRLTESQFKSISSFQTPQGILAVVRLPADVYGGPLPEEAGTRILLLEDVQDPGNVGTLIRTAAAFGFDGILMSDQCADPFSPKVVQASAGTVTGLWMRRSADIFPWIDSLKRRGFGLIALDVHGEQPLSSGMSNPPFILAVGNEGAGLSDSLSAMADERLVIPILREKAESLNAAVSGAIAMYLVTSSSVQMDGKGTRPMNPGRERRSKKQP